MRVRVCIFITLLFAAGTVWAAPATPVTPDIRVLIDVSGSMKKNDPDNLRVPALKLLVGMLPAGSRAGVWTFGEHVKAVLPVAEVTDDWRREARRVADGIHSREWFTDIEAGLAAATRGWTEADAESRRNIIVLTDGIVDISHQKGLSQASRQRLLNDLLPRVASLDARVHTIGLSAGADQDLLARMAAETAGRHEQVASADQLDRVFLRLFEQSAAPDSLPLRDNQFHVDDGIRDLTLLVFRHADGPELVLHPPGQAPVIRHEQEVDGVGWQREQDYDLVTIDAPARGSWRIEAPLDQDNRVLVATNLRLDLVPLPAQVLSSSPPAIHASLGFNHQGGASSPQDLVSRVRFSVRDKLLAKGDLNFSQLQDQGQGADETAGDGVFSGLPESPLPAGEHVLVVIADGGSFVREKRHRLQVHAEPVVFDLRRQDGQASGLVLQIRERPGLLKPGQTQIKLSHKGEADPVPIALSAGEEGGVWTAELAPELAGQVLDMELVGLTTDGSEISLHRDIPVAEGPVEPVDPAPTAESSPRPAVPLPTKPLEDELAEGADWQGIAAMVVIANLVTGLAGWMGYRRWRKRKSSRSETALMEPADESAGQDGEPPGAASEAGETAGSPEPDERVAKEPLAQAESAVSESEADDADILFEVSDKLPAAQDVVADGLAESSAEAQDPLLDMDEDGDRDGNEPVDPVTGSPDWLEDADLTASAPDGGEAGAAQAQAVERGDEALDEPTDEPEKTRETGT